MARIEQSAVNVPPDRAFDYLADVTRHTEWGRHLTSLEKIKERLEAQA